MTYAYECIIICHLLAFLANPSPITYPMNLLSQGAIRMTYFYAILAAIVIYMTVGGVWFSKSLFGKEWFKHYGQPKNMAGSMMGAIINAFIVSCVLLFFVLHLQLVTFFDGAILGFLVWLGFVATTHFSSVLWAKQPIKLYWINQGAFLLSFVLMAGVISVIA
mgnify:FL=1